MSRHVNDIKNMIFDQPEFESDDDDDDNDPKPVETKKSTVETIVFRDRAKKTKKLPIVSYERTFHNYIDSFVLQKSQDISVEQSEEFDLEKARFDVHKFGIKGFEKSQYEDARTALAVSLGAKVDFLSI